MNEFPQLVVVDANAYWTSSLFSQLAPRYKVLLMEPRELRAHAMYNGGSLFRSLTETPSDGVTRHAQPMPPRYTTASWPIAKRLLAASIQEHAGSVDTLVICFPDYLDLASLVKPRRLVYYNYDSYEEHWPHRAEKIRRDEQKTVARADATICIAKKRCDDLSAKFPKRASSIHHIPIGVTPEFMASSSPEAEPDVLRNIPRPIAGYVGTLGNRLDFDYLAEVASSRPNVSFVLGGPVPKRTDGSAAWWHGFEKAEAQGNVHFIGWVHHETLGQHLRAFDALLMVYSNCAFNESACPAKLWDYFGVGTPIVANDQNPETRLWQDVVSIASDPKDFATRLDAALAEGPSRADERLAIAKAHTWSKLADRVALLLSSI